MAKESIEIVLQGAAEATNDIISSLEINSDDNDGKSSFTDNDAVKIRFLSSSNLPYTFGATLGTVSKVGSNIQFEQVDYVEFANSQEEKLTYFPIGGAVVYEWVGVSLGSVTFNGNTVKINAAGYGILKATYQAKYDLMQQIIPRGSGEVKTMVWVKQGETSTTQQIDYGLRENQVDQGSTVQYRRRAPYLLQVLDYTTGSPISDVRVSLRGIFKGYTNSEGKIFLGDLLVGNYTLQLSKENYFSSGSDGLNNDSFSVSAGDLE